MGCRSARARGASTRSCGSRSWRGRMSAGGIGGLRRLARRLADSDLPVVFTPGVIHLDTVPPQRKVNRVDLGTADKVCAAALAIEEQRQRTGKRLEEISLILLELGGAFTAAVAVDRGRIVDGLGGSSGPIGWRAAGRAGRRSRVPRGQRGQGPVVRRRRRDGRQCRAGTRRWPSRRTSRARSKAVLQLRRFRARERTRCWSPAAAPRMPAWSSGCARRWRDVAVVRAGRVLARRQAGSARSGASGGRTGGRTARGAGGAPRYSGGRTARCSTISTSSLRQPHAAGWVSMPMAEPARRLLVAGVTTRPWRCRPRARVGT